MQASWLGRVPLDATYAAMRSYTEQRQRGDPALDQIWLCEHDPVFTLGLAARREHLLAPGDIAVIETDRGGQVTYHGPGQVTAYPLIDLGQAGYYVKEFVYRLEESVIRTLMHWGITGHRVGGAPGIYVRLDDPRGHAMLAQRPRKLQEGQTRAEPDFTGLGKIAALGIKVSRQCSYHGGALNVAMDLAPFGRINPCGYSSLQTVDLSTIGVQATCEEVAAVWAGKLQSCLAP